MTRWHVEWNDPAPLAGEEDMPEFRHSYHARHTGAVRKARNLVKTGATYFGQAIVCEQVWERDDCAPFGEWRDVDRTKEYIC